MWIELPPLAIVLLNVIGIPFVHLAVSWWATTLPARRFDPESFLYRERGWEDGGRFYDRVFHARRWKDLLPDAAPWFRGFPKGKLSATDPAYLTRFRLETCRGEFAHWIQVLLICGFVVWNPFPANVVIVIYAVFSNLPCLITQRQTRARMGRVLGKCGKG